MRFLSDDDGNTFNLCHCEYAWQLSVYSDPRLSVWSNFEIADMDFWRSEAYTKYFDYLESAGGFYYEVCISFSYSGLPNIIFSDGETHRYIR
jgi:alpha 1,2-mannosyltransferase